MKTLGGLANSIKPRMANTMAVTISPSIIKPSRPLTATITGEEPMLCANNPTLAATRNPSSMSIRAKAHFVLVVGRREIDQHFKVPARSAIHTNAWPATRPASVGVTSANQSNGISFVTKLMGTSARSERYSKNDRRYCEPGYLLRQAYCEVRSEER